jgi:regulator of replication initiation timing
MITLPCYRVVGRLRTENTDLRIENEALNTSLHDFTEALKMFRRDVLAELAELSERLSYLEYRGMDSDGMYE